MADLQYGTDFDGRGPGLDFTNTIATCSGPRVVQLACVRRCTYSRGHFPWSPDRGFDLRAELSKSGVKASYLEASIVEQYEQDERVQSADVLVSQLAADSYQIKGTPVLPEGPFPHVVAIEDLTLELLNEV